jgi:AcrR family transcriptional regulator
MGKPTGRRGDGRRRLLQAALQLFTQHGVSGTSLQMIADEIGVTKAAVYHQFSSKTDIVLAVVQPALEQIATLVDAAERASGPSTQVEAVLNGLVELVLDNHEFASALQRDPEVIRILDDATAFRTLTNRLDRLIIGPSPSVEAKLTLAMVGGGLMTAGLDPTLSDLDRETARTVMIDTAQRALAPYLAKPM